MWNYEHLVKPKIVFGPKSLDKLAALIRHETLKKKIALISDPGKWIEPLLLRIEKNLNEGGLVVSGKYTGISPNPMKSECDKGIQSLKDCSSEICIAVGGGSTLDASKLIAQGIGCEVFITIPTTAGTGSELNEWAVITDDETHIKMSIQCKAPNISLLDPRTTVTVPPLITLFTGMDALSHGIESLMSTSATTISDILAYKGCRRIIGYLENAVKDGNDMEARSFILEGSMLTGMAMANASNGILHALANILPGFCYGLSHGEVCANLLVNTVDYNKEAIAFDKYIELFPMAEKAGMILNKIQELYSIREIVLTEEIVSKVVPVSAVNVNAKTNPEKVDEEGVENLLRKTFKIK
ncbi:MAG: iron-containing alcohol dehydrogenase [Victivallales bacterium]|nr:iron-containing alcohol dehydrogenase [Victivallales bacterium]